MGNKSLTRNTNTFTICWRKSITLPYDGLKKITQKFLNEHKLTGEFGYSFTFYYTHGQTGTISCYYVEEETEILKLLTDLQNMAREKGVEYDVL